MNQLACRDGERIVVDELSISVLDIGFVQGVTVSEQLRTFGGKLFQLDEHMQRLQRSLQIIGISDPDIEALKQDATAIATHNHQLLEPGDDLGLTLLATPGTSTVPANRDRKFKTWMYTAAIPFQRWAEKYSAGESLITTSIRQVPSNCWPTELKCRSRMHYYLADREAQQRQPGARALLLDQEGFVAEASTASVIIYRDHKGIVAPPPHKVLPSVSIGVLKSLADRLGINFQHRDMTPEDVVTADEVLLSSTSPCVLPVVRVDDAMIGGGVPGPVFASLIAAWSRLVEVDIVAQAARFAIR